MADRLTPAQMLAFARPKLRQMVTREAYIDNAAISPTDITSRVKSWGEIDFQVYNRHPDERGALKFPVMSLQVDNRDHYFDRGRTIFPNGSSDFASTVVHVAISIGGQTFLTFDGRILQPEYTGRGYIDLVCEHPLTAMTARRWTKDDRIGGDTGINGSFVS